jgi:O-antigen/teichoic acid export membrane protein
VLAASASTALTLGVFGPWVLRIVFGRPFAAAALPLRLLLPGQMALDLIGPFETRMLAEGRPSVVARAAVVGCVITLLGVAVVVPRWGILAAATVTSVAALAQLTYLALRAHRPSGAPLPPLHPGAVSVGGVGSTGLTVVDGHREWA